MSTGRTRKSRQPEQSAEGLYQALQRVRFHVARMPLAHIVWGADFRAEEWNPAAEKTFGFTADEAIGRHAYDLIVPRDVHAAVEKVWAELLAGDESSHSINDNVCKDGTRIRCEWFNTPLRDASGRIVGVASMAQDVSEREVLEAQLRRAQKLESLGMLAGGVAHDFNNLLTIMLGNAALLRNMPGLPKMAGRHLTLIEEAAGRAASLTEQLLRFGGGGTPKLKRCSLNHAIRGALKLVRSAISDSVTMRTDFAPKLPGILADPPQVEQVIMNLCMNASDAMPNGGSIAVRTAVDRLTQRLCAECVPSRQAIPGSRVVLSVTDDGVGMSESTMERMFDPFFTTRPAGHGLGMAAVLGIIAQHNACVRVESALGRGTSVQVYFPMAPDTSETKGRTASREKESQRAARRPAPAAARSSQT
ncbi:MAG TPA: ATP-binding protein [Phycisphaerae bacterium]|nr:ATP-binding protein [Phycisphaerae bacterium]